MKVKAAQQGLKVPREDNPRRYIEDEAVEVPDSPYYQRQIIGGDLVVIEDDMADATTASSAADTSAKQSKQKK